MKSKIAFSLLLAGGLYAAFPATPVAVNFQDNVSSVYLKSETKIYFGLSNGLVYNGTTVRFLVVDRATVDPDNFEKIYSLLVTAQLSSKRIKGSYDGANISNPTGDGNCANLMSNNNTVQITN
ncbi:MAG: hypothetical protein WBM07_00970 [Chitinivibrionales bacterium]